MKIDVFNWNSYKLPMKDNFVDVFVSDLVRSITIELIDFVVFVHVNIILFLY